MHIEMIRFEKGKERFVCGHVTCVDDQKRRVTRMAVPIGKKAGEIQPGDVWACEIGKYRQCRGEFLCDVKPKKLLDLSDPMVFRLEGHPQTGKDQWSHTVHLTRLTSIKLILHKEHFPFGNVKQVRVLCKPEFQISCKRSGDHRQFMYVVKDRNLLSHTQQLALAG